MRNKGLYTYSIKIDGLKEQNLNSVKISEYKPNPSNYLFPTVDDITVKIENADSDLLSFVQDKVYSLVETNKEKDYRFDCEIIQRDPHGNIVEKTAVKNAWIQKCVFDNFDEFDTEDLELSITPGFSETVRFNLIKNIAQVIFNIKKLFR